MNIEEAKEILNEAVINEPSINSYMYISAEDINNAIGVLIQTLEEKEHEINELNEIILEQKKSIQTKGIANTLLNKVGKKIILGNGNILGQI